MNMNVGANADLLIHEATFESEMKGEAVSKKHCTTEEAITVGNAMNAKYIVLTHFSQRYPKIPVLPSDSSANIGIAFDFMTLRLNWLDDLVKILPQTQDLFKELEESESQAVEITEDTPQVEDSAAESKKRKAPPKNKKPVSKKSKTTPN